MEFETKRIKEQNKQVLYVNPLKLKQQWKFIKASNQIDLILEVFVVVVVIVVPSEKCRSGSNDVLYSLQTMYKKTKTTLINV